MHQLSDKASGFEKSARIIVLLIDPESHQRERSFDWLSDKIVLRNEKVLFLCKTTKLRRTLRQFFLHTMHGARGMNAVTYPSQTG